METEKASHEEEERLTDTPPSVLHPTGNEIAKLQNGNHFPGSFPQEVNGNATWNEFKSYTEVKQVKRHCDVYSSPAGLQEMFNNNTFLTNGEIKHALSEPSLLRVHHTKKIRVDSQVNGKVDKERVPVGKAESVGNESELDCFSDLPNVAEFECDVFHQEKNLDGDKYFFPNGDVFLGSSNKQVLISNGATEASPSAECLNGDAVEKTLCQYYPDHRTTSPQSLTSQKNEISHLAAENVPEQTLRSPSFTSGLPVLPQTSDCGQQHENSVEAANHGSYSAKLAADPQQSQEPCPTQDVPASAEPHRGAQETVGLQTDTLILQDRDNAGDLLNRLQSPNVYLNPGEVVEDAFNGCQSHTGHNKVQSVFANEFVPEAIGKDGASLPLVPPISNIAPQKCNGQFGTQQLNDCQTQDNRCGPKGLAGVHLSGQVMPANEAGGFLNSACITGSRVPLAGNQGRGGRTESGISIKAEAEDSSQLVNNCHAMNWTNLDFPPSPQTWKTFGSHLQQVQQDMGGSGRIDQVQRQDFPQKSNFHHQEECGQPAYKETCDDQLKFCADTKFLHKATKLQSNQTYNCTSSQCSQQCASHNQRDTQINNEHLFQSTQEYSKKIITSNTLLQKQSQSHCYTGGLHDGKKIEKQLIQNVRMRPMSPMHKLQDGHLMARPSLVEYSGKHKNLEPSDCTQNQHQTITNPSIRNADGMLSPSLQVEQPAHGMMLGYPNGTMVNENCKLEDTIQKHHQQDYCTGPTAKKQCLQHHPVQQLSSKLDAPHLQSSTTLMQNRPQFTRGASNQQGSEHTALGAQVKTEWQGSCSQVQGWPQAQQHGEVQRHAALRMHLLQRQEKQEIQKSQGDFGDLLQPIKLENNAKAELLMEHQGDKVVDPALLTTVKQEHPQTTCDQLRDRSVAASMEHQFQRCQVPPGFLKAKPQAVNTLNKIKVETSGPVTIISTHVGVEAEKKTSTELSHSKKSAPNLSTFFESPIKLLETPIKNLLDTPVKTQYDFPSCHCVEQLSERDEGPYYTHLGAGPNVAAIRELMEKRFDQTGNSIRIEKVVYTGKEGKSTQGCPIAKWVIRRASVDEKLLVLVRERAGHTCATATIVVVILIWEGIPTGLADRLYSELSDTLMKHGALTNRRCAFNEERTCACQGLDSDRGGASFSFGCSWSMYYNGCKFARSKFPRKFKLLGDDPKEEEKVEQHLQSLATLLAPTYKKLAPDAYANQVEYENRALHCRLGLKEGRPFSGVTACLDFCAHAHRDLHNMQGGSTVVCTLTREDNREIGRIPEEEQLHVLPLYKISQTDEFGSAEAQQEKMKSGAIQVLSAFRRQVRVLPEPAKCCRLRKLEGKKANKLANADATNLKTDKALQAKVKQENTKPSTPVSGPQTGQNHVPSVAPGQQPHPFKTHGHPQLGHPLPYPGSPQHARLAYPRFPNQMDPFLGTSQSNMHSKSSASVSSFPSPLHMTNTHLNGLTPTNSPYPGSLNPSTLYPGYPCNGTIPMDSPFYTASPKHLSMYQQQRSQLYSQQYSSPTQFGVSYAPPYSNHSAHVSSYKQCNIAPGVHSLGPYSTFGLNSRPDPQFIEAISQPSVSPFALDYGALNKNSQYSGSPNPYLAQSTKNFTPGQDPFHMHGIPEMELHSVNGITPALPPLGVECPTKIRFGFMNGSIEGTPKKQEQESAPGQKEELWSDNEHNFLDPEIGGVAVAPSHGSILIECAKREMHATTPLKDPDRNHPARISLVFYQHKNLNEARHGLAAWEAKMAEKAREKEEDAERHGAEGGTPGKNRKVKREHCEIVAHVEPPCKRFILKPTRGVMSCTTTTYVNTAPYAFTKTTGPYSMLI